MWFCCLLAVLGSGASSDGMVQTESDLASVTDPVDFESEIQPLLATHCLACHGPSRRESNYRLDVKQIAMQGGDFGEPPIVPGRSGESPLVAYISGEDPDLVMPPSEQGSPMTPEQIDLVRRWIDQGAKWPEHLAGHDREEISTDHWAFQPIRHVEPPQVRDWPEAVFPLTNPIDRFVAKRLQEESLEPSPPADRTTLIRRIFLDLHGLQPDLSTVQAYQQAQPGSYSQWVDQLLAHPHYGERWARHWLDVVRFGESTGFEVNRDRPNAFYYRDYVIDSLNQDKSYRDFVREQLAGDILGVDEATGFLVGGPNDIVKSPDINLTLMQRQDELADYVHTTSASFLALTVACARCHNHKFDAILQKDYYALQAVFAGVRHGERPLKNQVPETVRQSLSARGAELAASQTKFESYREHAQPPGDEPANLLESVNAKRNTDRFTARPARFVRFTIERTNGAEPCLDELEVFAAGTDRNIALASEGGVASSSGNYANNPKHQLPHIHDGLYGNDKSWISDTTEGGWVQIEFPEEIMVDRVDWGRDRTAVYSDRLAIGYRIALSLDGQEWQVASSSRQRKPFLVNGKEPEDAFVVRLEPELASQAREEYQRLVGLRKQVAELQASTPTGYVGLFGPAEKIKRLHRGDPLEPREEIIPDTLTVMGSLGLSGETPEAERRLKLADWLVDEANPLTARVIVNRVWHYHFGAGLVDTPSDFGVNGARPTHPELLDWLAWQFMEHGWSLKWLHRQILNSSTYRQSSAPRAEANQVDADGRLLWRFPPRRLEAEAIRDCVLQLSGKLNPKAGGPGFLLFEVDHENVHHYFPLKEYTDEHFRRMIYMTKIRQEQDEVFGVFDCPDGGQTIPRRNRSTTALQALNLLNSRFMLQQASFLADRLQNEAGDRVKDQVRLAFELAYSRQPAQDELDESVALIELHGLEAFCRALLNSNEFLFLS
ncbi:MAG: PSD1 and planctomycete cytochrome C domain-containing protein [Mariniblastus sp.]|nr:PSD1 and planctomycete cytochrome C domain-containing protein [Mariniblastus sp.]